MTQVPMRVTAERTLRNGVWRITTRVTRGRELVVQTVHDLDRFTTTAFWRIVQLACKGA